MNPYCESCYCMNDFFFTVNQDKLWYLTWNTSTSVRSINYMHRELLYRVLGIKWDQESMTPTSTLYFGNIPLKREARQLVHNICRWRNQVTGRFNALPVTCELNPKYLLFKSTFYTAYRLSMPETSLSVIWSLE